MGEKREKLMQKMMGRGENGRDNEVERERESTERERK